MLLLNVLADVLLISGRSSFENMAILSRTDFSDFSSFRQSEIFLVTGLGLVLYKSILCNVLMLLLLIRDDSNEDDTKGLGVVVKLLF